MKKFLFIRATFVAIVLAVTTACSPTTTSTVTNAVNIAQQVDTAAQTVLSGAEIAWPLIVQFIAPAGQAAATAAFSAATLVANKSLLALSDAIAAAQAANQTNPDFSAAIAAVTDAVSQVIAIVNQFKTQSPASAAPGMLSNYDPNADLAVLKRVAHVK